MDKEEKEEEHKTPAEQLLALFGKVYEVTKNPPKYREAWENTIETCGNITSSECGESVKRLQEERSKVLKQGRELVESAVKVPGTSTAGGPPGIVGAIRQAVREVIEFFKAIF